MLTAGMSYQALFAVFAGLWVGFGVFGIVLASRPELLHTLVEQINTFVPGLIGPDGLVHTSLLLETRVLSWTSAIAAGSLIWVMMNWFTGTRRAIRIIFGLEVKQYRNAVLLKLRDLSLAIVFALALVVSAALTLFSSTLTNVVLEWLGWSADSWLLGTIGTLVRYGALYAFDVAVLIAIHRLLAEVRVPWMPLLAGSALGAAALLMLKILGSVLLGGASRNPLLASFALIIGLLIWFNFICRVLLLTAAWIEAGLDKSVGLPVPVGPMREEELDLSQVATLKHPFGGPPEESPSQKVTPPASPQ